MKPKKFNFHCSSMNNLHTENVCMSWKKHFLKIIPNVICYPTKNWEVTFELNNFDHVNKLFSINYFNTLVFYAEVIHLFNDLHELQWLFLRLTVSAKRYLNRLLLFKHLAVNYPHWQSFQNWSSCLQLFVCLSVCLSVLLFVWDCLKSHYSMCHQLCENKFFGYIEIGDKNNSKKT